MKKLINRLRGCRRWRITGDFPERMLNLCGLRRLPFWQLRRVDEFTVEFSAPLSASRQVEELAARAGCTARGLKRYGLGADVAALGRRWGFVAGLAICLTAVSFLSRFLLVVEVKGNTTVPTAVILSELSRLGVRPGAFGPSIQEKEVANEALLALPGLSYMAVNIYGTRAEVAVAEAVEPPELLDEGTPADVVAAADGIILSLRADSGRAMFAVGDIVAAGEVLLAGRMDLPEPVGGTEDMGVLAVRASGSVRARTWRMLEESIPLTAGVKTYTGAETTRCALQFLWTYTEFFQNSSISYPMCDKITCTRMLTLAGRQLPVGVVSTTYREYTVSDAPLDAAEAEKTLRALLTQRLSALMDAHDGVVLRSDMTARVEDGRLTVTLLAECEEEIGRTVELPGETGHIRNEE